MNTKTYADNMIKNVGFEEAKRIVRSIDTKLLRTIPDLITINKKKQTVGLTMNSKTAAFFDNVRGYLRNLETRKNK